jgi:hypothetical protein
MCRSSGGELRLRGEGVDCGTQGGASNSELRRRLGKGLEVERLQAWPDDSGLDLGEEQR